MNTLDTSPDTCHRRNINELPPIVSDGWSCGRNTLPATRGAARVQGAPRYFTGKPCKHGHIAPRLTGGGCVVCKQLLAAAWYYADPSRAKARSKAYRVANPERAKVSCLASAKAWYRANPEKASIRISAWKFANREAVRASYHKRRAREVSSGGHHTAKDITALFKKQTGKCAHSWCRRGLKSGYHIDHVLPLAKGGSNDKRNIQLLCVACNLNKGTAHPIDYARQHGMLL